MLILVKHAENKKKDTSLTHVGVRQALILAKWLLKQHRIDNIYTTDKLSSETATPLRIRSSSVKVCQWNILSDIDLTKNNVLFASEEVIDAILFELFSIQLPQKDNGYCHVTFVETLDKPILKLYKFNDFLH